MTTAVFPELRHPIQVGTMALDHRIVVPPHGGGAGALLGSAAQFEQHCAHWLAKIEGGVQWIGGGPTFVRNPLPPGFEPNDGHKGNASTIGQPALAQRGTLAQAFEPYGPPVSCLIHYSPTFGRAPAIGKSIPIRNASNYRMPSCFVK